MLACQWKFSEALQEAAAWHHTKPSPQSPSSITLVQIACRLSVRLGHGISTTEPTSWKMR